MGEQEPRDDMGVDDGGEVGGVGGSGRHGWLRRCGTALGSPFRGLASLTFGTVSVDLSRRQRRPYDVEDLYSYSDNEGEREISGLGKMRVKAYRRMALEPYVFVGRKAQVDLAAGISLSTSGEVVPKCRLKIGDHVRLKAFPVPALQFKQVVRPMPQSKFALQTEAVLPLECFRELSRGERPASAYVGVRLRNDVSTGLHLTSRGVEFDERVQVFGPYGTVRAAVGVDFPTEFPPSSSKGRDEVGGPFRVRVNRLKFTIPTR